METTGERLVVGESSTSDEAEHTARYRFASGLVSRRSVVDIACGSGYGTAILADASPSRLVGVDVSEEAVAYAQQRYHSTQATFVVGDVTSFGEDSEFDVAISFETIEHVTDAPLAIANMYRLLRRGGRLVISSPYRHLTSPWVKSLDGKPKNRFHVREFLPHELGALLEEAGFKVSPEVFGQRQQPHLPWWLAPLFTKVTRTYDLLDPSVRILDSRDPRFFVLLASKD